MAWEHPGQVPTKSAVQIRPAPPHFFLSGFRDNTEGIMAVLFNNGHPGRRAIMERMLIPKVSQRDNWAFIDFSPKMGSPVASGPFSVCPTCSCE